MKRCFSCAIFLPVFLFIASACGLSDVNYLKYVDAANVMLTMNNHVDIHNLPEGPGHNGISRISLDFSASRAPAMSGTDVATFVQNFELFYKIYTSNTMLQSISETNITGTTSKPNGDINDTLKSDYTALKPYTVITNNYATSVSSAFNGRRYYSMDLSSSPLLLLRSIQLITPYPANRYFFNAPDLINPAYVNINNNYDVVLNSSGNRYVYTAIYVAHYAFDSITLSSYYSVPTFLGVFLLPDTTNAKVITFASAAAAAGTPTPQLILTFAEEIPGLLPSDIDITDAAAPAGSTYSITKGTMANAGAVYTLGIIVNTAPPAAGTRVISVAVSKAGFTTNPASMSVTVNQL